MNESDELPPAWVSSYLRRLARNRTAYAEALRLRDVPLDRHRVMTCPCVACHAARVAAPDAAFAALGAAEDRPGASTPPRPCSPAQAATGAPCGAASQSPTDTTTDEKDGTAMPRTKTAPTPTAAQTCACRLCGVPTDYTPPARDAITDPGWPACPACSAILATGRARRAHVAEVGLLSAALGEPLDPEDPAARRVARDLTPARDLPQFAAVPSPQVVAAGLADPVPRPRVGAGSKRPWAHIDAKALRKALESERRRQARGPGVTCSQAEFCSGCGVHRARRWTVTRREVEGRRIVLCDGCFPLWSLAGCSTGWGTDSRRRFADRLATVALRVVGWNEHPQAWHAPEGIAETFGFRPFYSAHAASGGQAWDYLGPQLEQARRAAWERWPSRAPAEYQQRRRRLRAAEARMRASAPAAPPPPPLILPVAHGGGSR
ncbi:hypothetical protein [Nocardioides sp. KR10-350]|uniref:hypothetical protein n=1 Tax=Nocardioides cheoyonin TaxID=3156615 RepID=UPI0032B6149F